MTLLDKPVEPERAGGVDGVAPATASARRRAPFPLTVGLVVALLVLIPVAGGLGAYPIPTGDVVAEAMAVTEVAGFAARPFSALSGGERARVALARVPAQRAPLPMPDEPTAALDLRHQELALRVRRERARAGDAVVVVLHDPGLAAAYADRVAILRDGRIAADGPPAEVRGRAAVGGLPAAGRGVPASPDR